jgi:hypothetical protein
MGKANSNEGALVLGISWRVKAIETEWSRNQSIKRAPFEPSSELAETSRTAFESCEASLLISFPPSVQIFCGFIHCHNPSGLLSVRTVTSLGCGSESRKDGLVGFKMFV